MKEKTEDTFIAFRTELRALLDKYQATISYEEDSAYDNMSHARRLVVGFPVELPGNHWTQLVDHTLID